MIDTLVLRFSWPCALHTFVLSPRRTKVQTHCCDVEKFIVGGIYKDWVGSTLAWDCRLANSRVKQSIGKKSTRRIKQFRSARISNKNVQSQQPKLERYEYNGLSWGRDMLWDYITHSKWLGESPIWIGKPATLELRIWKSFSDSWNKSFKDVLRLDQSWRGSVPHWLEESGSDGRRSDSCREPPLR